MRDRSEQQPSARDFDGSKLRYELMRVVKTSCVLPESVHALLFRSNSSDLLSEVSVMDGAHCPVPTYKLQIPLPKMRVRNLN